MNVETLFLNALALTPSELYQSSKAKARHKSVYSECAACGSTKYLEVHHIVPVHVNNKRASDLNNLITLCDGPNGSNSSCHRYIGHLGNFRSDYNKFIREHCWLQRRGMERVSARKYKFTSEQMLDTYCAQMQITRDQFFIQTEDYLNIHFDRLQLKSTLIPLLTS